jgi:hypothetical protein
VDTKQLYLAAGHLRSTLTWQDWIHFGTGKEVNHELIEGLVDNFINDNILNLVQARDDSNSIKRIELKDKISGLVGQEGFQIWNSSMTKAIDFNRIGGLRLGRN